nr:aldehyde dehydrogenase family protein [uncultured Roseateles sp.]
MHARALPSCPDEAGITTHLQAQKAAFCAEGPVSAALRRDRLQRCVALLSKHSDRICELISADFGGRHPVSTLMMDVQAPIAQLKYASRHVSGWMRPQRRAGLFPFNLFGARSELRYQPKGVVGIAGTWNGPLFMLFAPLASVFAAGNRAMLKPSDLSPLTSEWLAEAVAEYFDPLELSVVTGGIAQAQAFTRQAFDHLVFTGSTDVARQIMRDAAANLVPLTLELGGKSPAIVGRSADIAQVADKIAMARAQNGGQICVMPDTVYLPRESIDTFTAALRKRWAQMFPQINGNTDLTSVASQRHLERIEALVEEARAAGASIESLGTTDSAAQDRRRPLRLVINAPADCAISRQEIFGPAMAIQAYDDVRECVARVNAGHRPLALYYFGRDKAEQEYVLGHTLSGGACVNDAMLQVGLSDVPFGGIGASGMGVYNGPEGFAEFSHLRGVYHAGWWDPRHSLGLNPPFSNKLLTMLRKSVQRA